MVVLTTPTKGTTDTTTDITDTTPTTNTTATTPTKYLKDTTATTDTIPPIGATPTTDTTVICYYTNYSYLLRPLLFSWSQSTGSGHFGQSYTKQYRAVMSWTAVRKGSWGDESP